MTEMVGQETTKTHGSYDRRRTKQIQYACGCTYSFDHQIRLEHICPEHERDLVTLHGWYDILVIIRQI
jgi:hypothetical protein